MLEMLSSVADEKCFALKGGTAINFFVRDMPRLSVDIDLTYLPIEEWETSLKNVSPALGRIAIAIRKKNPDIKVQPGLVHGTKHIAKLHVVGREAQIKIEPNPVIRGHAFATQELGLAASVEELFGIAAQISVVSKAELYGGKLCAALDRQHPRDLFDVKVLFESEGLTDEISRGFIVMLASHSRPMSELLSPIHLK